MDYSRFTKEEKEFIKQNAKGLWDEELAKLFNERFNKNKNANNMHEIKWRLKVDSGLRGHKWTKETAPSYKEKKGPRWQPIGTEHKSEYDGYTYVKIAEPNKWIRKQRYIYEKFIGPIPQDCYIIFADGNKENFNLDNLIAVSKSVRSTAVAGHLLFKNKELTETGLLVAKLINKSKKKSICQQ